MLKKEIAHYIEWKSLRHPSKARQYERVLLDFLKYAKIHNVTDLQIHPECLQQYRDSLNAQYQKNEFDTAMRGFLKHWYDLKVLTHHFDVIMGSSIIEEMYTSPTMHVAQVRRVHQLRKDGKSLRQIKVHMESEDNKIYHLKQIQRWAGYAAPKLSTGTVDT